ncbi:MAG: hypothetical protein NTV29_18210 [Planctomycetota bacterium]|nr:hypothetical protein [Planctomycetota bacterium]
MPTDPKPASRIDSPCDWHSIAPWMTCSLILCSLAMVMLPAWTFAQSDEELPKPILKPNQLGITQSIQKSKLPIDLPIDREICVKKSKGRFTLNLDKAFECNLQILPAKTLELVGQSQGQWRIKSENLDAEIILTVQSEPALDWHVSCAVQIPSETDGPLVALGPDDPESVLRRLNAYDHWLKNTVDRWNFSSASSPKLTRPSSSTRPRNAIRPNTEQTARSYAASSYAARSYGARQKETQRSVERWTQIEQLASQIFNAAHVQCELIPAPIDGP